MVPRRHRALALVAAVLLTVAAGCSSSGNRKTSSSPATTAPPATTTTTTPVHVVYVAVGASESVGFGADDPATQAWPVVLDHTALPADTTFTNLGIPGATVSQALTDELPKAVAAGPTLVTVWLNVNDIIAGVSPATYQSQLQQLLHGLRRGGATRVLVANTPPIQFLPIYLECSPSPPAGSKPCPLKGITLPGPQIVAGVVDAYNSATAQVASAEGATVVDLHAAGMAAEANGTFASLVGKDGFHPSTAGHQAVAAAFAAALKS